MRNSNMANQRQIDEAASIEYRADELREQAVEALTKLNNFAYDQVSEFGNILSDYVGEFDVMEAVGDLAWSEVALAFSKMDSDPLEAVRIIKEARDTAVRHVVGKIDFESAARAEQELNRRAAA